MPKLKVIGLAKQKDWPMDWRLPKEIGKGFQMG